jgi:hypothetical protein
VRRRRRSREEEEKRREIAIKARFWPGFLVVIAGWCSGAWCCCCVCVVWGGGGCLGKAEGEEKGKGKELEGDDAVFLRTGLIFGRTIFLNQLLF